MTLAWVWLIPPNKDYIVLKLEGNVTKKIPRSVASYLKVDDVCEVVQTSNKLKLRLLTDEDEFVIMNHPDRKRLVPYGFFDTASVAA